MLQCFIVLNNAAITAVHSIVIEHNILNIGIVVDRLQRVKVALVEELLY